MQNNFSPNHPVLFILAGIAVCAVMLQSVFFLRKSWKRAIEMGYSKERLKKLVVSAILFTIAPAVAIGIGIITLSGTLGLPLPWLRLSVVGSLVYELSAAETAAKSMGAQLGSQLTAQQFSTIAWTMTIGITTGAVLIPVFCKKYTGTFANVGKKDRAWGDHFTNAIFIGLIATFVGQGLSGIRPFAGSNVTAEEMAEIADGRLTALVLLVSCIVMIICGFCRKKFKWTWLNDYALPICMVVAMASAIPLSGLFR